MEIFGIDILTEKLFEFGRWLRLRDGWILAQRTLWIAFLIALLIQLVGRFWPVPFLWWWTALPFGIWLILLLGWALLHRQSPIAIAHRLDDELALKERLATAYSLSGQPESSPLVAYQRQDALETIQELEPRRVLPFIWLRRPLWAAGLLCLFLVGARFVPNPMEELLRQRAIVEEAAEAQAEEIERLQESVEESDTLSPEQQDELLRRLEEVAQALRENQGDREEALSEFSKLEEFLREQIDPNLAGRQEMLENLAAQLRSLAENENDEGSDLTNGAEVLEQLSEQLGEMDANAQNELALSLSQMAGQASLAGENSLAQSLAALAQSIQLSDEAAIEQAADDLLQAFTEAEDAVAAQGELQQTLAQAQAGRQAMAGAGQPEQAAAGQGNASGQNPGQGRGSSQQAGSGGGTNADQLPGADRVGSPNRLRGANQEAMMSRNDQQIYVPWERREQSGEELFIPGQESGEGTTEIREQRNPLPGVDSQPLVPYQEVYYDYLDTANQALEQSAVPAGLESYVRDYFSQLEP